MKSFSLKAKFYIFLTILCGVVILLNSLPEITLSEPWMVLALCLLASAALIFRVDGTTDWLHFNISFLIYSFAFVLLGPADAVMVILVSNIAEWAVRKNPWYIQAFNTSNYFLAIFLAQSVYEALNPGLIFLSWAGILSSVVAMLVVTIINHLLIGSIIWLVHGAKFDESAVFDLLPLMIDFTLLCMGIGAALVWDFSPLAIVYSLLPLYLIYNTLRVPYLERLSILDPKTGLYNARHFSQALAKELERANRFDHPLTVVMADMDLLRNVNNTYGHIAGDEVLIGVASILKDSVREYDVVARFGGEEFIILMPETYPQDILQHIEDIRSLIEKAEFTVPTSVTPIKITMSFGIAGRVGFGQAATDIVHNADTALYRAKLTGRNCVRLYSDEEFEKLFVREEEKGQVQRKLSFGERLLLKELRSTLKPVREQQKPDQEENAPSESAKEGVAGNFRADLLMNTFIASIALLATIWFIIVGRQAPTPDWIGLLLFAAFVVITEGLSINIYFKSTSVSTSTAPMLGGILLFGPVAALVLAFTSGLVNKMKQGSPLRLTLLDISNQLLAGLSYSTLLHWHGTTFLEYPIPVQILITLAAAGIVYFQTTFLNSIAIHFSHGISLRKIWQENYSWLAPYYLAMGVIAYAFIFTYTSASLFGLMILLVPLLLVRLSQKQFIDRTRAVVLELRKKNLLLESNTNEINRLNESLLEALSEVIDLRDPFVLGHSKHVTRYAVLIAEKLGLPEERVDLIRKSGLLHDIGKLGIPDSILLKPSKLNQSEFEIMKAHTTMGAHLLETSHGLRDIIPIVRHHHEWFDGSGYPDGLKGKEIPLEARIVSLADAVEAMASDRPYRKALEPGEIIYEIKRAAGQQFDPEIVKVFVDVVRLRMDELIVNSGARYFAERERMAAQK